MEQNSELIIAAIKRYGTEEKAAEAFGVSQPVVNEAKRTGKVGPKLAMGIHSATKGEISKSDLRPDLWPREVAAE
jgi:DNA-binding transcriptional regulator YdaS (Cro superfamily)